MEDIKKIPDLVDFLSHNLLTCVTTFKDMLKDCKNNKYCKCIN